MINLFKDEAPKRAERVCRVENLNPQKQIIASMIVASDRKKYSTCLLLSGNRAVKNTFNSRADAEEQMLRYKELYSILKDKKAL